MVRGFNPSFVTLILKVENPQALSEYRPISSIRSMYKILAKMLSSRLSSILKNVSESQSAFLPSRSISNGILISNEVIDEAKKLYKEVMFFKVDFAKAFDSVDWDFLDHMLHKLGFCSQWHFWIWECISPATMLIFVNDSSTREFELQ